MTPLCILIGLGALYWVISSNSQAFANNLLAVVLLGMFVGLPALFLLLSVL